MAQKTDSQLITEANVIRDETAVGANTALRVGTMFDNVVDSKVNNDKISTDIGLGTSDSLVPSQNAVKTYVDGVTTGLLDDRGNYDASVNLFPSSGGSGTGGAVKKGDLWYISVAGTLGGTSVLVGYSVRALSNNPGQTSTNWAISNVGLGYVPEDKNNKSTDVTLGTSDVYYPTQNAVKTYVDNHVATALPYTPEDVANKNQDIALAPTSTVLYPSNKAVADFVTSNSPSLQDVIAVNSLATSSFIIENTDASIRVMGTDGNSAVQIEAVNGSGGYMLITNQDGNSSEVRATNLTAFRTHQLPDESGKLVVDAPADSQTYARKNNAWVVAGLPYKVYAAVITLTSGGIVVTELQNTLGTTITWADGISGQNATASGSVFTSNKTWVMASNYRAAGLLFNYYGKRNSDTVVNYTSYKTSDNSESASYNAPIFIEIRVYP